MRRSARSWWRSTYSKRSGALQAADLRTLGINIQDVLRDEGEEREEAILQLVRLLDRGFTGVGNQMRELQENQASGFDRLEELLTRQMAGRAVTPDRAARVAFILATGARWGEADRAHRSDVQTAAGRVLLRGTKTELAARTVPIVGAGHDLLAHVLSHAEGADGLLFRQWGNSRRDLTQACERAGIPAVSPNDLRRTFGPGSACTAWRRTSLV